MTPARAAAGLPARARAGGGRGVLAPDACACAALSHPTRAHPRATPAPTQGRARRVSACTSSRACVCRPGTPGARAHWYAQRRAGRRRGRGPPGPHPALPAPHCLPAGARGLWAWGRRDDGEAVHVSPPVWELITVRTRRVGWKDEQIAVSAARLGLQAPAATVVGARAVGRDAALGGVQDDLGAACG